MTYIVAFSNTIGAFTPPIVMPSATVTPPMIDPPASADAMPAGGFSDDAMVDVKAAAMIVGLAKSTLDKKRVAGGGPIFVKYPSGAVRYSVRELRRWIRVNSTASTSEHWAPR